MVAFRRIDGSRRGSLGGAEKLTHPPHPLFRPKKRKRKKKEERRKVVVVVVSRLLLCEGRYICVLIHLSRSYLGRKQSHPISNPNGIIQQTNTYHYSLLPPPPPSLPTALTSPSAPKMNDDKEKRNIEKRGGDEMDRYRRVNFQVLFVHSHSHSQTLSSVL